MQRIAISGTIGAGKTTLCQQFSEILGIPVLEEPVSTNPYLANFYSEPKKYAYDLQMYFLKQRIDAMKEMSPSCIMDRTVFENRVFASVMKTRGLIQPQEMKKYKRFFNKKTKAIANADLIVYLRVDPEIALERIRTRGREYEQGIDLEYLQQLHQEYEKWIQSVAKKTKVVIINWNQFRDARELCDCLFAK